MNAKIQYSMKMVGGLAIRIPYLNYTIEQSKPSKNPTRYRGSLVARNAVLDTHG